MTLLLFILIILSFIFLIGTCIGSFLNVVILRAFSDESICFPGSKCPSCQKPLKWYHNIPILSYIFLKGKCAFCKENISIQYPIIELLTGILFIFVFLKFAISLEALFMLIFGCIFIVLAATDIKEKVVFDFHTYALIITALIYNFFNIGGYSLGEKIVHIGSISFGINYTFINAILGLILGVIIMEIFARFGYLVAGTRAFGEGDSYIAAGLGALFGWEKLLTALILSFIIQIILTIPVFIKKLFDNKDTKTLYSFIAFFILIILIKYLNYATPNPNMIVFGILTTILSVVGFYLCKRILGGLKDKSNMTYLPFGPAMIIAAFIIIFFSL